MDRGFILLDDDDVDDDDRGSGEEEENVDFLRFLTPPSVGAVANPKFVASHAEDDAEFAVQENAKPKDDSALRNNMDLLWTILLSRCCAFMMICFEKNTLPGVRVCRVQRRGYREDDCAHPQKMKEINKGKQRRGQCAATATMVDRTIYPIHQQKQRPLTCSYCFRFGRWSPLIGSVIVADHHVLGFRF
jgi:hypothetical protein